MKKLVRSVGLISAAVAFGAGTVLSAPLAGAQSSLPGSSAPADNCGETVVTPSGLAAAGWGTPSDETAGTITAVADAQEKVGAAALSLPTDEAKASSLYKNADKAPLSSLIVDGKPINLSYDYVAEGAGPALQIRLNGANLAETESAAGGYAIGFATIVYSPADSDGEWKTANAGEAKEYWVTRALKGADDTTIARGTMMSLKDIVALNPKATITEYGVQKTKNNTAPDTFVDNFTFGCEVTDFELVEPAAEAEGSLGNIFGSVSGIFQS